MASAGVHCRAQDGVVCAGLFLKEPRRHWVLPEKVGPRALADSHPGLLSRACLQTLGLLCRLVQERDRNVGPVAIEESPWPHGGLAESTGQPRARECPTWTGVHAASAWVGLSLTGARTELALRTRACSQEEEETLPPPHQEQASPSRTLSHGPRESMAGSDSKWRAATP